MNKGDIRVEGLEALRKWISQDDRYVNMIGACEVIRDAVYILGKRTIEEGMEEKKRRRKKKKRME